MLALWTNLDSITQMQALSGHELVMLAAQAARSRSFVGKACALVNTHLVAKPGLLKPKLVQATRAITRISRSVDRLARTVDTRIARFQTITLWQVVMLVTCVEAYLQDVLTAAASVGPELMSKSEQQASYADVVEATSLDALGNELRSRWARGWISDGGPTRWISRLAKMGAKDYPADLGPRLELFWGIRHVAVHAAGVATADFVKRHPGVVKAAGDRVRVNHRYYSKFVEAVVAFLGPTDQFFLARYPSMLAVSTAPAK